MKKQDGQTFNPKSVATISSGLCFFLGIF